MALLVMHSHLSSLQAPDKIKRQGAPDTGEMYTIPEIKGDKTKSFKKKETTPPPKSEEELQQIYSQADTGKNNQPPNEVSVRVCLKWKVLLLIMKLVLYQILQ